MKQRNAGAPKRKKLRDIMQVPGARVPEPEKKSPAPPLSPSSGFTLTKELKFYLLTGILGLVALTTYLFMEALG